MRRESYFKMAQGKRMLKLIIRDTFRQIGYKAQLKLSKPQ